MEIKNQKFLKLKNVMKSKHFQNVENIQRNMTSASNSISTMNFNKSFEALH